MSMRGGLTPLWPPLIWRLNSVATGDHQAAAMNEKEGELHQWWPRALVFLSHGASSPHLATCNNCLNYSSLAIGLLGAEIILSFQLPSKKKKKK